MKYLILHKVRGEPTFDVAERLCPGPRPCQPECGLWNGEECCEADAWIIPTSGHRAYPAKHWELAQLSQEVDLPDDLRDHYEYLPEPAAKPEPRHKAILARLGLKVKPTVTMRRL